MACISALQKIMARLPVHAIYALSMGNYCFPDLSQERFQLVSTAPKQLTCEQALLGFPEVQVWRREKGKEHPGRSCPQATKQPLYFLTPLSPNTCTQILQTNLHECTFPFEDHFINSHDLLIRCWEKNDVRHFWDLKG